VDDFYSFTDCQLCACSLEMELLQERCSVAEVGRDCALRGADELRGEREELMEALQVTRQGLEASKADACEAEEEVARLRTSQAQVKAALQAAYDKNQALSMQVRSGMECRACCFMPCML